MACAIPMSASAQNTVTWRSAASSGFWVDSSENRWHRFDDGWDIQREDLVFNEWHRDGSKTHNIVLFNNANQPSMTVNSAGGTRHHIHQLRFSNSTSRTFAQSGGAYLHMDGGSGNAKIEATSPNATGTYTFNVPIELGKTTEFNPVAGDLTFHNTITNNGNWIDIWGNNNKGVRIFGPVTGSGGFAIKQNDLLIISNNNTFSGFIIAEKGRLRLEGHTNAMGSGGVTIGTNATLELNYGAVTLRPVPLNLYGTGTNSANGAVRKTSSGRTVWPGDITLGADSKIVVTSGGIDTRGTVDAGSWTLYVTNTVAVNMTAGELTGSKTSGDGALHKSGSSVFDMRPASGLTGSIVLQQGEIRQNTGNSDTLPSGGTLVMENGTTYRSSGNANRTIAKNMQINGDVTLGHSGGGDLTFSGTVNLNGGTRSLDIPTTNTMSGVVSNGGLTKTGAGKLILTGANTYSSGTTVSAGILEGTTDGIQGNVVNNAAVIFTQGTSGTYAGAMSGSGTLTKSGSGAITFTGTNTHSGATTVDAGTLIVNGPMTNTTTTVSAGATLGGRGPLGTLVVFGTVSPGQSVTNLQVDYLVLEEDGEYVWEIGSVAGTPGNQWDVITVSNGTGTVTLDATSGNPFTIRIDSMSATPTGWNALQDYSWTIISAGSIDGGFDVSKFVLDTTDFTPAFAGTWSLSEDSGNIVLSYEAPETPMVWFPFTGSVPNPSNVLANISVTDFAISSGSLSYGSAQSSTWTGPSGVPYAQGSSGWNAGDQASAKNFNFTISADGGWVFSITSIELLWRRTGTGPTDVGIRINGNSELAESLAQDSTVTKDVSISGYEALTNAFIQLDGWGGGAGDFRVDDVEVFGDILQLPLIGIDTDDLPASAALGSDPANDSFAVTNNGGGLLSYVITTNVDWMVITPGTATNLAASGTQAHTIAYDLTGLPIGVHTGVVTITGTGQGVNEAYNSPQSFQVIVTINAIDDPTAATATADGNEMIRLAWTAHGSYPNVLILHKTTAIATDPTQGTAYSAGDTIDGATVIFNGSGSAREHVVATGADHFYKFYSVNNDHYSPGVTDDDSTGTYNAWEMVEPFAYTNSVPLSGLAGGNGWTNAWSVSAPNAPVDVVVDGGDFPAFPPVWPDEHGNRVVIKTTNQTTYAAFRYMEPVTNGQVYVAALYRRQFNEGLNDGKFSGISFFNGGSEVTFVGERGGSGNDDIFGVSSGGNGGTLGAINSFPAATNVLLIGRYDFDTGIWAGRYYFVHEDIPAAEPAYMVQVTNLTITRIDGVRLAAGSSVAVVGEVHFDELRVATNWPNLMNRPATYPVAVEYEVNDGNQVNTTHIRTGAFPVELHLYDSEGLNYTETADPFFQPNFDLWNPNGIQILTNQVFAQHAFEDAGRLLILTNLSHSGTTIDKAVSGIYTMRWSAVNSNGLATLDSVTLSNSTVMTFEVILDPDGVVYASPTTLVFNANVLANPSPDFQTVVVTNLGGGALTYTNIITYNSASGWLSAAPDPHSLNGSESQISTMRVESITLPPGTYIATNTIYADSAGAIDVVVTLNVTGTAFAVTYDTFNNTVSDVLHGKSGGTGWSGSWTRNTTQPELFISGGSIGTFNNYCNGGGHKAQINSWEVNFENNAFREAWRSFPAITSGVVYFSSKINIGNTGGDGRRAGFRMGDGGAPKIWVGKVSGSDSSQRLSVRDPNDNAHFSSTWNLFNNTDYLLIARYDFATQNLRVKGFSSSSQPGTSEPTTWDINITVPGTINQLNRFSMVTQNGDGIDGGGESTVNPGVVIWDDVRIARTWADLMCGVDAVQTYPVVTNAVFHAAVTNYVSDALLNSSNFPVTVEFYDLFGVRSDSSSSPFFIPDFDVVNNSGGIVANNQTFGSFEYDAPGRTLIASNETLSTVVSTNIQIGTHYIRWSAITSNEAYRINNQYFEDGSPIAFNVYDDDPVGPEATLLFVGTNFTFGATNDLTVTDADLFVNNNVTFAYEWYDPSGVFLTNANLSTNVGSFQGNTSPNWDLTPPNSPLDFDMNVIHSPDELHGNNADIRVTAVTHNVTIPIENFEDFALGTWTLTVSAQDEDRDRGYITLSSAMGGIQTVSVDRAITSNQPLEFIVIDDDADPPAAAGLSIVATNTYITAGAGFTNLLAGWNFNDSGNRFVVSHGAGSFSDTLASTNHNSGTTVNAVVGDAAGDDLTVQASGNIGRYIQFDVGMTGYQNLIMTFGARRSDTGYNSNIVEYAVNGGPYTVWQSNWTPTNVAGTAFGLNTFNFTSVTEMNDAETVSIRITFGVDGVTGGGNNRFDNIRFNARRTVLQVTDRQLARVSVDAPMHFSFRAYDDPSGIHRGTTFDGTNMHISIPDVITNNTDRYQAAMSSADTIASTATSLWSFTSFEYNQIGDLYGDGTNYVPVMATMSDRDADRPNDAMWVTNAVFGVLHVIDNDTIPPRLTNINHSTQAGAANRPFFVTTNGVHLDGTIRGTSRRTGTLTNTVWAVTDAELANPADYGLQFAFGVIDTHSGISRDDAGTTNSVLNFRLGDIYTDDYANFDLGASSANYTNASTTNVWTFANGAFSAAQIDDLFNGGNNPVRLTMVDNDDDRPDDGAIVRMVQAGFLAVLDDDVEVPLISNLTINVSSPGSLLTQTFDSYHGWTNSQAAYGNYSNHFNGDVWIGEEVIFTPLVAEEGRMSGLRVLGMRNQIARFTLPERENPGNLLLWARLSGDAGVDTYELRVEGTTNDWVDVINFGDRTVTNTAFELLSWTIQTNVAMSLRVDRITPSNVVNRTIFIDDIHLTAAAVWTNAAEIEITWPAAFDPSGINGYGHVEGTPDWQRGSNITEGTALSVNAATVSVSQGSITGFVFAVDNDNDRSNDRMRNAGIPYVVKIDRTPPAQVANVVAEEGFDDTSEISVNWQALVDGGGGDFGYGFDPLSPWRSYRVYYSEDDVNGPTTNDPFISFDHIADLSDIAYTNAVISNLVFDTTYAVAVAGEDAAGNVGPLSDFDTVTLAGFNVTQGVALAETETEIHWKAATNGSGEVIRDYDLIRVDGLNFVPALTSSWQMVDWGFTNALVDTNAIAGNNMRFYRASRRNRWTTNNAVRLASEEVYVAKPTSLYPGQNWVGHPGIPDTNTASYLLGRDLPAGPSAGDPASTRVTWYARTTSELATNQIGLVQGSPNEWVYIIGGAGSANDALIPVQDGFIIEIPTNQPVQPLLLVGRVPTNTLSQTMMGGQSYNFVNFRLPRRMHPSAMNLVESGFTGATTFRNSDKIWRYDRVNQSVTEIIWYRTSDSAWCRRIGATDSVLPSNFVFAPDDALVIFKRSAGNDTWNLSPPYPAPTRYINP